MRSAALKVQEFGMTLDGWDEIWTHLQVVSGVTRSLRTVQRWAKHDIDPLPVFQDPGGGVKCDSEHLEEWWDRHRFTY